MALTRNKTYHLPHFGHQEHTFLFVEEDTILCLISNVDVTFPHVYGHSNRNEVGEMGFKSSYSLFNQESTGQTSFDICIVDVT